jgi:hypothetical protein
MSLVERINGRAMSLAVGTVAGLLVAIATTITLHFALRDRIYTEGAEAERTRQRIERLAVDIDRLNDRLDRIERLRP